MPPEQEKSDTSEDQTSSVELREKIDHLSKIVEHRLERIEHAVAEQHEERTAFQERMHEQLAKMREELETIEDTETQSRTFTGATLVFAVFALSAMLLLLYFIFQMMANVV